MIDKPDSDDAKLSGFGAHWNFNVERSGAIKNLYSDVNSRKTAGSAVLDCNGD